MSWLFDTPWLWWIVGAALVGLELAAPGVFLLWIGLGAVATGVVLAVLPGLPLTWQLLAFAALMLASLAAGVAVQRRANRAGPQLNQELQGLVGRRFQSLVTFEHGRGRVQVGDSSYAAESDEPVMAGELVEVAAAEGTTLHVKRVTRDSAGA